MPCAYVYILLDQELTTIIMIITYLSKYLQKSSFTNNEIIVFSELVWLWMGSIRQKIGQT